MHCSGNVTAYVSCKQWLMYINTNSNIYGLHKITIIHIWLTNVSVVMLSQYNESICIVSLCVAQRHKSIQNGSLCDLHLPCGLLHWGICKCRVY